MIEQFKRASKESVRNNCLDNLVDTVLGDMLKSLVFDCLEKRSSDKAAEKNRRRIEELVHHELRVSLEVQR